MKQLRALMFAAIVCGTFLFNARAATFGDFTYTDQGDSVTITGYSVFSFGAVDIPAEIGGKPVTVIADHAFYCVGVTALTIPDSVTSIGEAAFGSCHKLKSVTIPAGVKSIGSSAFFNCDGLEKLMFSTGLSSIGDNAFINCEKLTEVALPAGLASIGDGAFSYCTALEQVSVGGNLASIGSRIFERCENIKRVTFADGMKDIPGMMFDGCQNLASVEIPDCVESIGEAAFSGCYALRKVALPVSLVSIGDSAFYGSSLTMVTIPASVESMGKGAFGHCGALKRATFLGDAPALGESAFVSAAESFTVYWYEGREGFTAPTWQGYAAWMVSKGPEIVVYEPRGFELVDGSGKKSYGGQRVGTKSPPRIVTIRNRGSKPLRDLSVRAGGNHPEDFIIREPKVRNLPPGAATTFKVRFKPQVRGSRNAVIRIRSNDPDESWFEIHVDGHGVR